MGALPQALEIIFEVQMKRNNEKLTRRKINFSTYKMFFLFFSSSLDPLIRSNLITFVFLVHFKQFKVL
jgi:hypothetical protein